MAEPSTGEREQTDVMIHGVARNCSLCEGSEPKPATKACETCGCLYCIDCLSAFHPNRGPLSKHTLIDPENYPSPPTCEHHEPHKLYCNDCDKLVCIKCCVERCKGHTFTNYEIGKAKRRDPKVEHQKVLLELHHLMPPDSKEYKEFRCMCESKICRTQITNSEDVMDLCRALTTLKLVSVGNYGTLLELLKPASPRALNVMEEHVKQFTTVTMTDRAVDPGWQSKDNVVPTMRVVIDVHGAPESLLNNQQFQGRMKEMIQDFTDCNGISITSGSYILSLEISSLEGFLSIWLLYLDLTFVHRISSIFQEFTEGVHIFMSLLMTDSDMCTTLVAFGDQFLSELHLAGRIKGYEVSQKLETIHATIENGNFGPFLRQYIKQLATLIDNSVRGKGTGGNSVLSIIQTQLGSIEVRPNASLEVEHGLMIQVDPKVEQETGDIAYTELSPFIKRMRKLYKWFDEAGAKEAQHMFKFRDWGKKIIDYELGQDFVRAKLGACAFYFNAKGGVEWMYCLCNLELKRNEAHRNFRHDDIINCFLEKALNVFQKEGLIKQINYTPRAVIPQSPKVEVRLHGGVKNVSAGNLALSIIRRTLRSIQVSQSKAKEVEHELIIEVDAEVEMGEEVKIPFGNISTFIGSMEHKHEWFDEATVKEAKCVLWVSGWGNKITHYEIIQNTVQAKLGAWAFKRTTDGAFVDWMYCLCNLKVRSRDTALCYDSDKIDTFFWWKALAAFREHKYIPSLEEGMA